MYWLFIYRVLLSSLPFPLNPVGVNTVEHEMRFFLFFFFFVIVRKLHQGRYASCVVATLSGTVKCPGSERSMFFFFQIALAVFGVLVSRLSAATATSLSSVPFPPSFCLLNSCSYSYPKCGSQMFHQPIDADAPPRNKLVVLDNVTSKLLCSQFSLRKQTTIPFPIAIAFSPHEVYCLPSYSNAETLSLISLIDIFLVGS